jgi:hypothetical protein
MTSISAGQSSSSDPLYSTSISDIGFASAGMSVLAVGGASYS